MILAKNGKDIPKEWQHDPELKNNYGNTVAMILARLNKEIPNEWKHDRYLRNNDRETV